jgi:hypothetical protein
LFAAGVTLAVFRRDTPALALLAFPAAMVAIYASFFSEVRYHLAIAPLLFPMAALSLSWMVGSARARFRGDRRWWLSIVLVVVALFTSWRVALAVGEGFRRRHRWAVTVCTYPAGDDAPGPHLCSWRSAAPTGGDSPVRGTWDGVGIALPARARNEFVGAAGTQLSLLRGRYHLRARLAISGTHPTEVAVSGAAGDTVFSRVLLPAPPPSAVLDGKSDPRDPGSVAMEGSFNHPGGPLKLDFNVESVAIGSTPEAGTVWISEVLVERFAALDIIPRR